MEETRQAEAAERRRLQRVDSEGTVGQRIEQLRDPLDDLETELRQFDHERTRV
ncbi:MAG TPA: hypothetical protein VFC19_03860 [Candidatus Limnocylindrales bacterium]|nr:hypothetical protein [Candidatus Limnocylindrales bacterium]